MGDTKRVKILVVDDTVAVALNSVMEETGLALCFELQAGSAPPSELMIVPPRVVTGLDGRSWANDNPAGIVDFFKSRGLRIPFDLEHATEKQAPQGNPAPAVAWGIDLEVREDGSVWAKVDWNKAGADLVMNREYSYYSPAYVFNRKTMQIIGIKSVGLTNTPNLSQLTALNSEHLKEESPMLKKLLLLLSLPEGATEETALNHVGKLQGDLVVALNSANSPSLDKFVPRADYDVALNRATVAEGKLADQEKDVLETAINSEIYAALAAGKITPATRDYHVACCRQEGGLARFKQFVAAAPAIADDARLDGKKPTETDTALNAEEQQVCENMGLSVDDYKKHNNLK